MFAGYFQGITTLPASSPAVVTTAAGGRVLLSMTRKPEWKLLSDSCFSDLTQHWLPERLNAAGLGTKRLLSKKEDGMSSRLLSVRGHWKVCRF